MFIASDDPRVAPLTAAIIGGDAAGLRALLAADPELATARIGDERQARTPLHVATDFPGHLPRIAATIGTLVDAGADLDAPFVGRHAETPLHWAASCDDVEAIDALVAAADPHWLGYDDLTPLAAAQGSGNDALIAMLRRRVDGAGAAG
ncbi:MAG: hypothetical protein JWM12_2810 [Ilumatobacteraceae bacterium]|nr:hypothetical protein [Ilumatobacteraceae bacterium]